MGGLFAQKAFGYEEWKIGIVVPRVLKHLIELLLHFFPDGHAIGLYDHAATHRAIFGQVGTFYNFVVPG